MTDPSFSTMMRRLRVQDEQAAAMVFERYARRLVGLARTRLDARMKQKLDASDVVQSVFRSFFVRYGRGEWDFSDSDGLWALLVRLTIWKCARQARNFGAGIRDVHQEAGPDAAMYIADEEPTPDEVTELADLVEHLFAELDDDARKVVELRLQGSEVREIAEQIGMSERSTARKIDQVKERLKRVMGGVS